MEKKATKKKTIGGKILRIILWFAGILLSLVILLLIAIQLTFVQNFARKKIVNYVEGKIGTPFRIDTLKINFPKTIVLKGIYAEDQQQDTLLAAKSIKVNIAMLALLKSKVSIDLIALNGIAGHIKRDSTGTFNFDYIIDAFASGDTADTDTSAGMTVVLKNILLDDISVRYHDAYGGYQSAGRLQHFQTKFNEFDLDNNLFSIDGIQLSGVDAFFHQYTGSAPPTENDTAKVEENSTSLPTITLGPVELQTINFAYNNDVDRIKSNVNLGKLTIVPGKTDLINRLIAIEKISWDSTLAHVELGPQPAVASVAKNATDPVATIDSGGQPNWSFMVSDLQLNQIDFLFDNQNEKPVAKGIDYSHLDIRKLQLQANDIYFTSDSTSVALKHLSVTEKSGLSINELKGNIVYTETGASLNDFLLETPATLLSNKLIASYPSLEAVAKNIGILFIDAALEKSYVGVSDILIFVPDLEKQDFFAKHRSSRISIDGVVSGPLANLVIPSLQVNAFGEANLAMSGRLTNLTDFDRFAADVKIKELSTTSSAIKGLVPKGSIPESITLPERMSIAGSIAGNMQNLRLNLNGNTSMGQLSLAGTVAQFTQPASAQYDLQTGIQNFALGRFLQQDSSLGSTTFNISLKGKGFDPETMVAQANGTIDHLQFKGYDYQDLNFGASANAGQFVYQAAMTDSNASFALEGTADIRGDAPAFTTQLDADRIDLFQLNLTEDTLVIHAKLQANFPVVDLARLSGNATVYDISIGTGNRQISLDTVTLSAVNVDSVNSLTLKSPIADAALSGKFRYDQISPAFQNVISQYFDIGEIDSLEENQQVGFALRLFGSPLLTDLVPALTLQDTLSLAGAINSNPPLLFTAINIPALTYGESAIQKGIFVAQTENNKIIWEAEIDHANTPVFAIPKATLNGTVGQNDLVFNINLRDENDTTRYAISGDVLTENNTYRLSLNSNGLMLNYKPWQVNDSNVLVYSDSGIYADKFIISSEGQSLAIQSEPVEPNGNLGIAFKDFRIGTITDILQKDSLAVDGTINGEAAIASLDSVPFYIGVIQIDNFSFNQDTLGQFALSAFQSKPGIVSTGAILQGNGNKIELSANYFINKKEIDGNLEIRNLNLASIEGLMMGALRDMQGSAKGSMQMKGSLEQFTVNGNLEFDTAAFRIQQLNSLYRLQQERIAFNNNTISFSNFTVADSANNQAVVDGDIVINSLSSIALGLKLEADDFQLINSTAADNQLFYGTVNIDADLTVGGSLELPDVSGKLRVNENTHFTFVLPEDDPEVSEREGIVEFFDQDAPEVDSNYIPKQTAINVSTTKGLNLEADLELDKDAEFTIVVDAANGDFLDVKGQGNLSAAMNKDGEISLTGTYELKEGSYSMSITLLKRKFEIESGSTLIWQGSPTEADVDITAIYKAKAAPIDLLGNQIADLGPEARNAYKQRLPFDVKLKMKGELLKPEISFDIVLPEGNYNASSEVVDATRLKLEQIRREPAEQNKQVLSLLALGRFVQDDPFSSGSSTSYAVLARQSVSKLLTEQINDLASSLIKGVDINVGLESEDDYSTGSQKTRTDLNVGVSKTLLNDRLKVTVGSNFQVEGPALQGQQTNNIAGDVRLDYMLSKDGRYSLHAYRRNQYQVTLQGQVVETGLGFVISMDYNKFHEVFEAAKEKKQIRKDTKAEKKAAEPKN